MFSFTHAIFTGFPIVPIAIQSATEESIPSHKVGTTLFWIAIILVAAKVSGVVERFGQPSVLGELVIGVIIGNLSLIGLGFFDAIKTDQFVKFLAQLGVIVLLFQVGLETSIADMKKVGIRAFLVAAVGVILPFLLGTYIVGPWLLPGLEFNSYLFLGATLTATSVGITARVFRDLGRLQDPEAHIILGAAVIDDVLGLIILAVVSAIVQSGEVSIAEVAIIILKAVLFLGVTILLSPYIARAIDNIFSRLGAGLGAKFTVAISLGLLFAYLAELIGLAPIVGAFTAGLILDPHQFRHFFEDPKTVGEIERVFEQHRKETGGLPSAPAVNPATSGEAVNRRNVRHIEEVIEPISLFLVPIFFVTTGMDVNLRTLFDVNILVVAIGITIAAMVGKIAAGLVAGEVDKLVVGWGMVPRGEVGLIFAMTGKHLGVVDDTTFSVIVIMVIFSTLLPPPMLSYLLRRKK